MTVYNFGSINIDYVYRVPHLVRAGETLASESMDTLLGGKGANQSVAIARAGASVCHLGRLGHGDTWARDVLADSGVDVERLSLVAGASGHAIIQVDSSGENCIVLHGGANQGFDTADMPELFDGAGAGDWLLLQNECNAAAAAMDAASARGMAIAFNPAPMNDGVRKLPLSRCSLLVLNQLEAAELAGEQDSLAIRQALARAYPDCRIVLTLGAAGACILEGGRTVEASAPAVRVVDTTGAGDTFVGYCLAAMIDGLDAAATLERACAAAALAVTQSGATPSIPTTRDVDTFLQQAG